MKKSLALFGVGSILYFCQLFDTSSSFATGISAHLSQDDVEKSIRILSLSGAHRAWTAHAVPNNELGLDVGIETTFLQRQELIELGDGTGVASRFIPMPRLWFAWDLPQDFDVSFSLAPAEFFGGISAYGTGVQYVYWRDSDSAMNANVLLSYTYLDAFKDIQSHVFDLTTQISRDLVLWQPYAGAGFAYANSSVGPSLVNPGVKASGLNNAAFHFYVGGRIDNLAKLSFQFDLYGARLSGALLLSNSF